MRDEDEDEGESQTTRFNNQQTLGGCQGLKSKKNN